METTSTVREQLKADPRVEIAHVGGPAIVWVTCKVSRVGEAGFEWVNQVAQTLGELAAGFMPYEKQGKFWRLPGAESPRATEIVEAGASTHEQRLIAKQHLDWTTLVDRLIENNVITEADREVADSVAKEAQALHDAHVRETNLLVFGL